MKYFLLASLFFFTTNTMFCQENIIYDVKIQGNKKLKTFFIKRIIRTSPGGALDSLLLQEDIKQLKRLPSIAHASYQVFHSHDKLYNVYYNIEENFTILPDISVYTSTNNEFAYRVGVNEYNFLGQNMTLGVFFQRDIFNSYSINFRAPYLFNRQFGLAINYQDLTTQEPVFLNNSSADYKYNNSSIEVLGIYQINFKNRFELGINYFTEDYQYISGTTSANVPLSLNVKKLLYKFIYEYDNLDYYYQYVSGFKSVFNFQYVTSRNVVLPEFLIGWNDFFYFKRIGRKGNWANRMRLGISSNSDSPFAPFSVDNNLNVRGVGNTIDRGTGVIIYNTEYRHTLYEKGWFSLQGNAFIDAGSWRNPGGDFGDFGDAQNIRIYPGVGLRFISKKIYNATFRIDYGHGITKDSSKGFVFGIGQYF